MCDETEMWDAQLVVGDERRLSPHHHRLRQPGRVGNVGESTTSQRRASQHVGISNQRVKAAISSDRCGPIKTVSDRAPTTSA
jgi:hypothetical protein